MPPFLHKKSLSSNTQNRSQAAAEENQSAASFPAQPAQFKKTQPIQRQGNAVTRFIDDVNNWYEDKSGTASYHQPSKGQIATKKAQEKLKAIKEPIDKAIRVLEQAESMASPDKRARISAAKAKMSGLSDKLGKVEKRITDAETLLRIYYLFKKIRNTDPAKDPAIFALVMDKAFIEGGKLLAKSPHPVLGELGKFLEAGGESDFFMNMYGALNPGERYKHTEREGEGIQNEKELRDAAVSKGMDGMREIRGY